MAVNTAKAIRSQLHHRDPFEGFDPNPFPRDLQGGRPDSLMRQAFEAVRPQIVIEVGTWKGASACFWATLMREHRIDGAVICVDTWLGGIEHIGAQPIFPEWDLRPFVKHGWPSLYYQFLANVLHEEVADYIVPMPTTSAIAARWLGARDIQARLIYIGGSHDEDDVYADLRAYYRLLAPGGIICGDDWVADWYGVICAVNRFAREHELRIQTASQFWAIQKPGSLS